MNDYMDLAIAIAAILAFAYLSRRIVYRTCRCGTQYCNGCGSRRQQ